MTISEFLGLAAVFAVGLVWWPITAWLGPWPLVGGAILSFYLVNRLGRSLGRNP